MIHNHYHHQPILSQVSSCTSMQHSVLAFMLFVRFAHSTFIRCSSNMQVQRDARCAVSPMGQGSRRSPMSGIGFLGLRLVSLCLVNMQKVCTISKYTYTYRFLGTTTSVFICLFLHKRLSLITNIIARMLALELRSFWK